MRRAPSREIGSASACARPSRRICRGIPSENLLLFAHGGVINAFVGDVLGLGQEMFFLPENTSLNTIDVEADTRSVRFLNDVLHLTDPHFFE